MPRRRYRYADLRAQGRGSRQHIFRLVRARLFPRPKRDEVGRPFWDEDQLDEHDAALDAGDAPRRADADTEAA